MNRSITSSPARRLVIRRPDKRQRQTHGQYGRMADARICAVVEQMWREGETRCRPAMRRCRRWLSQPSRSRARWRHSNGFGDDTDYLELRDDAIFIVVKDRSTPPRQAERLKLSTLESFVRDGDYVEQPPCADWRRNTSSRANKCHRSLIHRSQNYGLG